MAVNSLVSGLLLLSTVSAGPVKEKVALVIIDVQNCFTPGGTLAVLEGDMTIPVINNLRRKFDRYFDMVVMSQDWHCSDHISFASVHIGHNAYSIVDLKYNDKGDLCKAENLTSPYAVDCARYKYDLQQTLWPDHCVINTTDAEFHPKLTFKPTDIVVRKGYKCHVDSYSVFYDNGGFGQTEMQTRLQSAGITTVFITGLARDYCVFWSAKDALQLGYKTFVVLDATRPVAEATGVEAVQDMRKKGINVVDSSEVEEHLIRLVGGSFRNSPSVSVLTLLFIVGFLNVLK